MSSIKHHRFLAVAVVALIVGGVAGVMAAQVAAGPACDVASVKPNGARGGATTIAMQLGRYTATHISLQSLIVDAYGLQAGQLFGGEKWVSSEHFDIIATLPAGTPRPSLAPPGGEPTAFQLMLRALLADRFHLVMQQEHRDLPTYELITARSDKKPGPLLRPMNAECAPSDGPAIVKEKAGKEKSKMAGANSGPRADGHRDSCRQVVEPGHISASAMTMPSLARSLSIGLPRTVVDRTGLSGAFDIELTWTPEQLPQKPDNGNRQPNKNGKTGAAPKIEPNGPAIFTALQEQLGLKLQSTKSPVDVFVIDHAERPAN